MANDRYRSREMDERNWRDRSESSLGRDRGDDDGYIARRGFGNERSGYDRSRGRDKDYGSSRERDFGDSAGYGTGGSTRDWRDVMGEDRSRSRWDLDNGYNLDRDWGFLRSGSSHDRDQDRYGSSSFGRGSRDYHEDRGFFERAGDEVRSWFGDDEAERRRRMDVRDNQEHHRGRGPRGYQRSDERILEDVNDRLTDDPHLDASEIDVSVSSREVTLNGTVNSRFEKRHAEDLAETVSGVTHVQNNLRIKQAADAGMGGSMLSGAGAAGAGTIGTPERNATGLTGPSSTETGGTGTTRKRTSTPSGT
jgi:osmotically-inducible protein OsmY